LIVCILTMIMEIVLFIIKIDRKDKNERYFSKSIEKMEKKKVWELNNKKKNWYIYKYIFIQISLFSSKIYGFSSC
jgi:hypothetical protein